MSPPVDAALTDCSVSFAAPQPHLRRVPLHAKTSISVPSTRPLNYRRMVGQAFRFVAVAGCRNAAHCTPEPYDNHSCEHRHPSHMAAYAAQRRPCRLPRDTKSLALPPTSRLISARNDFPPIVPILSLAQTLHRDRRRGTRVMAGSGVLPSETVGCPPFNVVPPRLAWPLS